MDKIVKILMLPKILKIFFVFTNLILFFYFVNISKIKAQNDSISKSIIQIDSIVKIDENKDFNLIYLKESFSDAQKCMYAPIKWNKKEYIKFSMATVVTGGLLFVDKPVQQFFQRNRSDASIWTTKNVLEPLGSGKYSIPLLALFYAYGKINDNNKTKSVALDGLKAFLITGICVQIPKHLFQRHRPYQTTDLNPYQWDGPLPMTNAMYHKYIKGDKTTSVPVYKSFPSGHSATSFAVATVFAEHYKEDNWIVITSYSLAALSALSRIHDNKHWISDVFVGSLLGYACGKLCVKNKKFIINVK